MHLNPPRNLPAENDVMKTFFALLIDSFAHIEGPIDSPSSLNAFTLETIRDTYKSGEVWVCASLLLAYLFFKQKKTVFTSANWPSPRFIAKRA